MGQQGAPHPVHLKAIPGLNMYYFLTPFSGISAPFAQNLHRPLALIKLGSKG